MKRYFYDLWFEYDNADKYKSSFHIGYFSSLKKVKENILYLKNQPGFCDYPIECFQYQKFGVNINEKITNKSGIILYVLSHEYENEQGEDCWVVFGAFGSELEAKKEWSKYLKKKIYKEHPNGFILSQWKVDYSIERKEGFSYY